MLTKKKGSSSFRVGETAIQSSAMEIDRGLEVLDVVEAVRGFLDPLDRRIDGFHSGIRDALLQIGEHVGEVTLDPLRALRHRPAPAVGRTPAPAGKEVLGGPPIAGVPELPETLLAGPGPCHLEVCLLHRVERGPLRGRHVRGAHEPAVRGPRQPGIARLLQGPRLRAAGSGDSLMQMFGHMEFVDDDLGLGFIEVGLSRLDRGLPPVHGYRLNAHALRGCQRGPEPLQTLLLPVVGPREHATARQIGDEVKYRGPFARAFSSTPR